MHYDLIAVGGGAAGIFGALSAKEKHPTARVLVLEKSLELLVKVRISGGGRCNVTNVCQDPKELVLNYPRGARELLGPFHTFGSKETVAWFTARGVDLKKESDGRIFPESDHSATIINALLQEAKTIGVEIRTRAPIISANKKEDKFFLTLANGETLTCNNLLLATGSNASGLAIAKSFSHTIVPAVPSLFTFNVPSSSLSVLSGIVINPAELTICGEKRRGSLLITHFGFSGPAALKLSAFAARKLHALNYKTTLHICWLPDIPREAILKKIKDVSKISLYEANPFNFPKNFWRTFCDLTSPDLHRKNAEVSLAIHEKLTEKLLADPYLVDGKTTHKEEFVTAGGIDLKEVNFKKMESRLMPGLFFAGEILDIDGVTGGFNFQNAWTTSFIAGSSIMVSDRTPKRL